jgi:hypothetical protein
MEVPMSSHRSIASRLAAAVIALGFAGAFTACGSNGIQVGHGDGGIGDGGGYGDGGYGDSSWPWPVVDGSADAPLQACAAETTKAQQIPLDIYIMLDQSSSMDDSAGGGQSKWQAVTTALAQFLSQPTGLEGVSVGLQYFAIRVNGSTSCDAAVYANPDVEIAALPGVATAIAQSILAHSPTGNTPTSAALQGAVNHAHDWAQAHPDHAVIVILATDGQPTTCDTDVDNIAAIAQAGVSGTPSILTFVIGVGSSLSNLNTIAVGGGTAQAYIVDTTGNVGQQFLDALNTIRGTALGCVYKLPSPDGGTPDFDKVNVQYTPGDGSAAQVFPRKDDQGSCPVTGNGWYYDNPSAPTLINLCPATCDMVRNDSSGQVDVLLGCKTILE